MSAFKAYVTKNIEHTNVEEFTPDGSAVWLSGDFVFYDTSTDTMKKCGADPALIAGLAENPSTYGAALALNGKVPVRLLNADTVIAMPSDTDFDATKIGDTVDISDATGGVWKLLPASTSNPRALIIGGILAADSLDGAIWFVQLIAANLQFDAVAS